MSHWQNIREKANLTRREICISNDLGENEIHNAAVLSEAAAEHFDLMLSPENKDSVHLRNCFAVLEDDVIHYRNDLPGWFKQFCIAHEFAHYILHQTGGQCSSKDIENFKTDEEIPNPVRDVIGYGANEKREREANLFALEFLLPCDILRELFSVQNLHLNELSKKSGLPKMLVSRQMARGILTPKAVKKAEESPVEFILDDSQKQAAETKDCPMLVTAGPGTGKTKTLIERILFSLAQGIKPEEILALTFSNKATEEMRERIAEKRPDEAKRMDIMTFHSFGLNILRKYAPEAGLENDSPLIDKLDAISFLENNLNKLDLVHFQSLSQPTRWFSAILGAISRAKDELKSPTDYKILAEQMLENSTTADEKRDAEKCLEIARVYEFYQEHLNTEKILDFGDLIFKSWKLLRERDDIRNDLRSKYRTILVDEYQDINRASGKLLKEISGDGEGLWAVGDLRQSIYRWRGASPANIKSFDADYPNTFEKSLKKNYRSFDEIIGLFSHFAKQMSATSDDIFCDWKAVRKNSDKSQIKFEVAGNHLAEAENLAENILQYKAAGVNFREQAVICRTHAQLKNLAETLTKKGIPILYLGDLFEREEIRDLLSLLDLKNSLTGHSLIRVATFSEYKIPLTEAQKIINQSNKDETDFQAVLADERMDSFLSDEGKIGWRKLKNHLFAINKNESAWNFLCEYLFEHSSYLSEFTNSENVQNQQNLLAIYQFLNFAKSVEGHFSAIKETQITEFLKHIRRVAHFGEDKPFAQIPSVAETMEAVRLLTVHAAKGLEFEAVFLPFLGKGHFPGRKQGSVCPTPAGLIELDADFHEEEEECLFFVGMSRAKNHLHLSRAAQYNGTKSNPSPFIEKLEEVLPPEIIIESIEENFDEIEIKNDYFAHNFHASQIKRYQDCPRKFYYRDVLKLSEKIDDVVYLKFHRTVYKTIGELQKMHNGNEKINEEIARKKLNENWNETDLSEHAYNEIYRENAEAMLKNLCRKIAKTNGEILQTSLNLQLENGVIFISPDFLETGETEISIRRFRTKKAPHLKDGKKEEIEDADVILQLAARKAFADKEIKLNKVYLADDIEREIPLTARVENNRIKKFENIISEIKSGNFPAKPDPETCPNCAYFFVCPK